jgi:uncharacterized phage protein (TIGR02218 family)
MRTASAALVSFLISRTTPIYKADLFTIALLDGTIYRWTDFDRPVTVGLNTWLNQGPLIQRTSLGVKNTVEVPELQVKLSAMDTDFVEGQNVKAAMHDGVFDGATLLLERIFMPTPGDTPLGPSLVMFQGRVSKIQLTAVGAQITVKGANVLMNQYAPRNQFQGGCIHAFCDVGCALLASDFTLINQSAGATPTNRTVPWASAPGDAAQYAFGTLTFTSGAAIGQKRTVLDVIGGVIVLSYPLYGLPLTGDKFSIFRGCDKTLDSGSGQDCTFYANTQHFRGFPFIPVAETAV